MPSSAPHGYPVRSPLAQEPTLAASRTARFRRAAARRETRRGHSGFGRGVAWRRAAPRRGPPQGLRDTRGGERRTHGNGVDGSDRRGAHALRRQRHRGGRRAAPAPASRRAHPDERATKTTPARATTPCASTCARWGRSRCSPARARSRSRSASRSASRTRSARCWRRLSASPRCCASATSTARAISRSRTSSTGSTTTTSVPDFVPMADRVKSLSRTLNQLRRIDGEVGEAARHDRELAHRRRRAGAPARRDRRAVAPGGRQLLRETGFAEARIEEITDRLRKLAHEFDRLDARRSASPSRSACRPRSSAPRPCSRRAAAARQDRADASRQRAPSASPRRASSSHDPVRDRTARGRSAHVARRTCARRSTGSPTRRRGRTRPSAS